MAAVAKNVLVVGASRGIGLEISNYLWSNGYKVYALAKSKKHTKMKNGIKYLEFDISDSDYNILLKFISRVKFEGIVFCVGTSIPAGAYTEKIRFEKTMEINIIAPFNFISRIKSQLKKNSSVIFLSSINARQGFSNNPGYVASKSGLEGLSRALATDFGRDGIRVNSLTLGFFPTNMTSKSFKNPSQRNLRSKRTILGRWGRLNEISPVVKFLLSEDSSYITGESISVDGGWLAKGI